MALDFPSTPDTSDQLGIKTNYFQSMLVKGTRSLNKCTLTFASPIQSSTKLHCNSTGFSLGNHGRSGGLTYRSWVQGDDGRE